MENPPRLYNHSASELDILETYGSYEAAAEATFANIVDTDSPSSDISGGEFYEGEERRNSDRPKSIPWEIYEEWLSKEWHKLLRSSPPESLVQEFLEQHPSLLPGAADDVGRGHHGSCWDAVITQPRLKGLGRDRIPDFMWVRSDTATVYVLCIEIEAPGKPWFTSGGQSSAELTQALDQLLEWKVWFSSAENMLAFRHAYIPAELGYRRIETQFLLIYGRDSEFRPGTSRHERPDYLRRKRDFIPRDSEFFYTFDQLRPERDAQHCSTISGMQSEFTMVHMPPTIQTGRSTKTLASEIVEIGPALESIPLISEDRKKYLIERWGYWRNQALRGESTSSGFVWAGGFFSE
ncbi:Shedu anti-phage system protein SduA domain-containing protein [Streptosporangium sp. NPDC002721]|uniref:Shedu anti-phage system protein SduA domain-containing protein n=1 Tax=Streptosporangium sp. NPDC002721 TaxID=3366188 RepID=UPI003694D1A3